MKYLHNIDDFEILESLNYNLKALNLRSSEMNEGFFDMFSGLSDWIKGLDMHPILNSKIRKLSAELVNVRCLIGKLQIDSGRAEELESRYEDEVEDEEYDKYGEPLRETSRSSSSSRSRSSGYGGGYYGGYGKSDSAEDIKLELLNKKEEDILAALDDIAKESPNLEKYVNKMKLEARFKSTEILMKIAGTDIKSTLKQVMADYKKSLKNIDNSIKDDIKSNKL